jgi:UDP-N-acetylmuramate dehydrogenase
MQEHVSLAQHSTMRLGGTARYLTELRDKNELPKLFAWADAQDLDVVVIGGGSNIIWRDEGFDGLVIVNKLLGFESRIDENDAYVTIAAGEDWDETVQRCCDMGLNGIAELSLIPGTAGATPVQNVGAYGREIADTLVSLEAYDRQLGTFVTLNADECAFGYRTSRFKTTDKNRFVITEIILQLSRTTPQPPFYQPVTDYFAEHAIANPTVMNLRNAVVAIRSQKLPDPTTVANNGSFFANPIISEMEYADNVALKAIKAWPLGDGTVKLAAASLLEAAGFKDYHDSSTGMGTWPSQPLVIVNESAKTTADLLKFRQTIIDTVQKQFGVLLEQEPELLP